MVEELKACLAESEDHRAIVVADSLKCLDAAAAACEANGWAAEVFARPSQDRQELASSSRHGPHHRRQLHPMLAVL